MNANSAILNSLLMALNEKIFRRGKETKKLPALMFIYPVTIALILLNILPEKYATPKVFRSVVFTTLLFSIPDFMNTLGFGEITQTYFSWIPLVEFHLGWVLPALVVFLVTSFFVDKYSKI